tara:strand:+ start:793 stop:3381 length:2589 start_codon:yes stop_codon:yes gene_type:complete
MAKSIMGDAQVNKIVTDSQQRVAKARKRGKKAAVVAPLVIGADQVLKVRAQNRAKDFWTGQQPELQKMEDYFNTSFQFQKDHTTRFNNRADWETQWKSDYHKQWIEDKLKNQGIGSGYTQEQLMTIAANDMKDDLTEYKRLLDLSADFKLSGDQTVEQKKARYFEPFNTATAKHMKEMVKDGGLLPGAINFIMGKKKWKTGSPEEDAIQAFKDEVFASSLAWDEQQGKYETAIGNNRLQNIFSSPGEDINFPSLLTKHENERKSFVSNDQKKSYVVGDRLKIKYKLEGKGTQEISPSVLTGAMGGNTEDQITKEDYWTDVTMISSALQDQYEKTKGAGGIYDKFHFMQEAIDIVSKETTEGIPNLLITKSSLSALGPQYGGINITYTPLTPERRAQLTLGRINSGGIYEVTSSDEQRKSDINSAQISRAMTNAVTTNSSTGQVTSDGSSDLMKLQNFLSNPENTVTKENVAEIEAVILQQPPSPVRDRTIELLATKFQDQQSLESMQNSMSSVEDNKMKEMQEGLQKDQLSIESMPDIDPTLGQRQTKPIKQQGYNSVEDVFADMKHVDVPGMIKTIRDTKQKVIDRTKEGLKSISEEGINVRLTPNRQFNVRLPTVDKDSVYSQENLEAAQANIETYVKETIPVVKKAAQQFIKDAPSKVKKAAKVVSDEANDAFNFVAKTDKYITSGELGIDLGFAKDDAVERAKQFGQDWITLAESASEKVKEFYDATEDARKDIKDQAKLMTFYDDFTTTNWDIVKKDIADTYIQFANENNIDITKAVQKGTATWLAKIIEDSMPISGRTMAQMSMQRQRFDIKQDLARKRIDRFNMKQDAAQDIVDFTKDSSQNIGLLARRKDSEEN